MIDEEWLREFDGQDPEILAWAFREHRRESEFFPSIAAIFTLIKRRKRELWEASEMEARRQERERLRSARAAGKLVDFADIKQKIAKIVAAKQIEPKPKPTAKPFTTLSYSEDRRQELLAQIARYQEQDRLSAGLKDAVVVS